MMINNLVKILVPPASPLESGSGMKWPLIEEQLSFPSDYIDFINVYGSGRIADFIVIFNPFSKNADVNFFEQYKLILEDLNYLIDSDSDYYKYQLYPKDNGLIPLGVTDNGDYIFWTMKSKSDSELWGTAIIPARSSEVEYFENNLITLLEGLLKNRFKSKSFPDNFPPDVIKFESI
ncbi:Uncharacterised protein [Yersinia nurmii]|uniref:SMI1 / KNR4 family n=1 Tax=Yersinia nurmii TaxID=685706 RepID=A0ABM9SNF9_9GAMM|nr:SMI1/KNR4 family protein [Yersinia nurmii]CNF29107.1 Uncharacterised protein [Yersinia nurmii]